ncbi:MAG TPA: hypothetical protein VHW67_09320 [Solirubrobacteraceae bacterium]|jgi:hypothetical protein|nr:hypothetical protein [Solirubrobacteraceae bacterium]
MEQTASTLELKLLRGARALLARHARELPQRDDLCGAFCGALALHAAGYEQRGGAPLDQDAVALAAGSLVSRVPDTSALPHGERGRRDYRIVPPMIDDASVSGTNCVGVLSAIAELSDGGLATLPYSGPWSATALDGLFDAAAELPRPVALIANLATRHLWGASPRIDQLLDFLLDGCDHGPPADWDVGHFVCVFGRTQGPGGALYGVADTYPSLGSGGVHLQPSERLARALARPDMAPGGLIVVSAREDAVTVRAAAERVGLREGAWDNGTLIVAPSP